MKWFAALIAVSMLVAACGGDDSGEGTSPTDTYVTGTVTAPPEAPPVPQLPANAVLSVTLQDVSRADAPAMVLSTQTIELQGQTFPVDYSLPYDLGVIVEDHTYSVAARVESNGDLLMISDTMTPAITRGAPTSDVTVTLTYIAAS